MPLEGINNFKKLTSVTRLHYGSVFNNTKVPLTGKLDTQGMGIEPCKSYYLSPND